MCKSAPHIHVQIYGLVPGYMRVGITMHMYMRTHTYTNKATLRVIGVWRVGAYDQT